MSVANAQLLVTCYDIIFLLSGVS